MKKYENIYFVFTTCFLVSSNIIQIIEIVMFSIFQIYIEIKTKYKCIIFNG